MSLFEGKVIIKNGVGYKEIPFKSEKEFLSIMKNCQIEAKSRGIKKDALVYFW